MNREQGRKKQNNRSRREIQNAFFEKAKQVNMAYSKCAEEIVGIYNQWIKISFDSEKEFLDIINYNDISVVYSECGSCVMCYLSIGDNKQKVGETFISQSAKSDDKERFKIDLSLILFHIISVCDNKKNKQVLRNKIGELL